MTTLPITNWMQRNADYKNPEAFIHTNPAYFAEEMAQAINNAALQTTQPRLDLGDELQSVLEWLEDEGHRGAWHMVFALPQDPRATDVPQLIAKWIREGAHHKRRHDMLTTPKTFSRERPTQANVGNPTLDNVGRPDTKGQ